MSSTFAYDAAGRLTREIAAGVSYVTNCYDGATTCADGNSGFAGGTYKLGRLTRRYGFNPRSPRQPRVTEDFTYDLSIGPGLSKKTTTFTNAPHATMPAINETWTYNALGLVDTYGLPFAGTTPNVSAALQYKSGLPSKLTSGTQTVVESAEYNPSAALSKWTAGSQNNVVTTIYQDTSLMPRPRQITTTGFDSGIYSYDGAGNITAIGADSFNYDARSRVTTGLGQTFQYDRYGNLNPGFVNYLTNRLTTAAYDDRGNQLRGSNQVYRYDELSRQIALDGGKERYLHNGAGERIARVTAPGLSFYTITPCRIYDTRSPPGTPLTPGVSFNIQMTGGPCGIPAEAEAVAGNLTETGSSAGGFIAAQPAGTAGLDTSTINFSAGQTRANNFNLGISPAGQLGLTASTAVHAIVDASGYYAYAGAASQETWNLTLRGGDNRLATEYTATSSGSTRKRNYFYFGSLLVATRDEAGTVWRFYASDHLGTPRVVTGSTGSVLETHKYKAFGEEIGGIFGVQPLKFAAMERDASSGNDYDHARYTSATLGRFLGPDLVGGKPEDPQSWNRYTYARNNPLARLDPDGLTDRSFYDVERRGGAWGNVDSAGDLKRLGRGLSAPSDAIIMAPFYAVHAAPLVVLGAEALGLLAAAAPELASRGERLFSGRSYEIAVAGGKHAGFLKNYSDRSLRELQKGIASLEAQIAKHMEWIADPTKKIPNFWSLDPRHRADLINEHWPGDIARHREQIEILMRLIAEKFGSAR